MQVRRIEGWISWAVAGQTSTESGKSSTQIFKSRPSFVQQIPEIWFQVQFRPNRLSLDRDYLQHVSEFRCSRGFNLASTESLLPGTIYSLERGTGMGTGKRMQPKLAWKQLGTRHIMYKKIYLKKIKLKWLLCFKKLFPSAIFLDF